MTCLHLEPSRYREQFHYRMAEAQFYRIAPPQEFAVVSVDLIVNPTLWRQYPSFVNNYELDDTNRLAPVAEYLLFHGTSAAAEAKIIREGFRVGGGGRCTRRGHLHVRVAVVCVSLHPRWLARVCPSRDSTIVLEGNFIQQMVVTRSEQIMPAYIIHYVPRAKYKPPALIVG